MTDILTKPDVDTEIGGDITFEMLIDSVKYEEPTDPNAKAHIVNPPKNLHIWREGMTAQDIVNHARVMKIEVVALCGYTWVPKHNPDKVDVCDTCMTLAGELMRGAGE